MAKSVYLTAVIATIAILLIVFFSVNVSESSRVVSLMKRLNKFL